MATHSSILGQNSMDRGTWRATVHRISKSQTTEATKYMQHRSLRERKARPQTSSSKKLVSRIYYVIEQFFK